MKKFILIIVLIFTQIVNVNAQELNSKYAVLYNLNEKEPLINIKKDEKTSVASLTKIMTVYTAIKHIRDFDEKITIRNSMFEGLKEQNAYVVGLKENQVVSYDDLLYATLLASGADSTRALVISIATSEEKFVELMNNEAQKLNLKSTHFTNAIGLDNDSHYSTVAEIATILKTAYKNEKFKEIFATNEYTIKNTNIKVKNSMKNAAQYYNLNVDNIVGAKTGYTDKAGRCLATIAYDTINDIEYLLVTTNAKTIKEPILDAINIYEYYFANYKYQTLLKKNSLLVTLPTKYSKIKSINFYLKEDLKKYLKNDYNPDNIKIIYQGENLITSKISKNKKIGLAKIYYADELIKEEEIILKEKLKFSLATYITVNKKIIISIFMLIILSLFIFILILKKIKILKK